MHESIDFLAELYVVSSGSRSNSLFKRMAIIVMILGYWLVMRSVIYIFVASRYNHGLLTPALAVGYKSVQSSWSSITVCATSRKQEE